MRESPRPGGPESQRPPLHNPRGACAARVNHTSHRPFHVRPRGPRSIAMIGSLARKRRVRRSLGLALTLLFTVAFLPPPPAALRVAAQEGGGALIPVIAPGSAYRQTNLISDVPGLSPVLDPLLVNPWGISLTASSPFWVANNGTSTTQL